jgi:sugar lactone lactonase YvrE
VDSIRRGDDFLQAGNTFEAIRAYEHARRVAYNEKLATDSAALEQRLAQAKAVRDANPTPARGGAGAIASANSVNSAASASSGSTSTVAPPGASMASGNASNAALADYETSLRTGDAASAVGNYFNAVLAFERAQRILYNNRGLNVDRALLAQKLTEARNARDGHVTGAAATGAGPAGAGDPNAVVELTALLDAKPRTITGRDVPQDNSQHYGPHGSDSRWIVSNPYLPMNRHFLPYTWTMACTADGSVYLGGESVVPALEWRRQPRANLDWYANNSAGAWKVAPDGKVTAFGVRPYGNSLRADVELGKCGVNVRDAGIAVEHWGGMVVDASGDVLFSDRKLGMIMKLRGDGFVEHVAGGGPQACAYERYRTPQKSGYQDGPAKQALFDRPGGLALDRDGNLFVADEGNCSLRRIDRAGNVTTVGKRSCNFDKEMIAFRHVAIDTDGMPIVAGAFAVMGKEVYNGVYRFHPDGRIEALLKGRQIAPQTRQQYVGLLEGLAVLPDGTVLVSDAFEEASGNRLLQVRGGGVSRYLGAYSDNPQQPEIDGAAEKAVLFAPAGLCASGDGTLFIQSSHSLRPVRKFDPRAKTVTTWVY